MPGPELPNAALSPGAVLTADAARVCTPGYSQSVRDVSESEKDAVYAEYQIQRVPYQYEVDHVISLELGGSNSMRNLFPEHYSGRWGAHTKDRIENTLHGLVCDGRLALRRAQRMIASNWIAAYERYIGGTPPSAGGYADDGSGSSSGSGSGSSSPGPGSYYASSYPTATTIYCADDSAWKSLSPTYLRRFASYAAALRTFPGRHLHQPC